MVEIKRVILSLLMGIFILTLICSSIIATTSPVIEWNKTFGGDDRDYGYAVQQTLDGGYIIAGSTNSFNNGGSDYDIYVLKTDSNGEMQWNKTFGGEGSDYGYAVQPTSDGKYVVAGSVYEPWQMRDPYLFKLYPNGTEQWVRQLSDSNADENFHSVKQTSDGGYIALINKKYSTDSHHSIRIFKLDSEGSFEWARAFLPSYVPYTYGDLFGRSIQQTSDGGYIIVGYIRFPNNETNDVYLIKTDSKGDMLWNKTFGWDEDDEAYSVKQTSDGGYIITGYYTLPVDNGYRQVCLIKTDSNGNIEWNKTFGRRSADDGRSVQRTSDGGYIIAGSSWDPDTYGYDVYVIKTDAVGNKEWEMMVGDKIQEDKGYDVQQTSDGGFIIVGNTWSFGLRTPNVYLIKLSGTLNINLKKGWNLISSPLNFTNLTEVFEPIKDDFVSMFSYDAEYQKFIEIDPFSVEEIYLTHGAWINVLENVNLTITGKEIENMDIPLFQGWNLVGYPYIIETDINNSDFKNYTTFAYMNNSWSSYIPNRTFNSLQTLKPGYGYWVKAE